MPAALRTTPTLPLADLLRSARGGRLPPPLDRANVTFWFSARTALWQALKALGVATGTRVALPAFCCGSELDAFLGAGMVAAFYRCRENLAPDQESFERATEGAGAALVTHYFGTATCTAELKGICRRRGIPLIEDCAHALYARGASDWLGGDADAAVFSPPKTLALPDGGALCINWPGCSASPRPDAPPSGEVTRRTRSLVMCDLRAHRNAALRGLAHLPALVKAAFGMTPAGVDWGDPAEVDRVTRFRPELRACSMSQRSLRLLAAAPHDEIRQVRRRRYAQLGASINDSAALTPQFAELTEGACPLFFPVRVADPVAFQRALRERRLAASPMWSWFHPAVPWQEFALEAELKRSLYGLPVHQALRDEEVDRLSHFLRGWRG